MQALAVFRTDAAPIIGTGHIMRCRTLARGLREQGFDVAWIVRRREGIDQLEVARPGERILWLPAPEAEPTDGEPKAEALPPHLHWLGVPLDQEIAETHAALCELPGGPRALIVDHYALDARAHRVWRSEADVLLGIDDLADRELEVDLLLDANYGRMPADYASRVPGDAVILTGPAYALLRPEFAALRAQSLARRATSGIRRVLVTLGGADREGATAAVVQAFLPELERRDLRILVLIGALSDAGPEVIDLAAKANGRIEVDGPRADIAQLMAEADLAVGAVGMTTWERCALGLPSLHIVLAENQRPAATALEQAHMGRTIAHQMPLCASEMRAAIALSLADEAALVRMGRRSASLTDGRGTERVVGAIVQRMKPLIRIGGSV